jgi:hypothetical protein
MNRVNPYEILVAPTGAAPPLVMILQTSSRNEFVGGVPANAARNEHYVLLSALPEELRQRVVTAIQALQSGM